MNKQRSTFKKYLAMGVAAAAMLAGVHQLEASQSAENTMPQGTTMVMQKEQSSLDRLKASVIGENIEQVQMVYNSLDRLYESDWGKAVIDHLDSNVKINIENKNESMKMFVDNAGGGYMMGDFAKAFRSNDAGEISVTQAFLMDPDSRFLDQILLHEMIHANQDKDGKASLFSNGNSMFDSATSLLLMEAEAYAVTLDYVLKNIQSIPDDDIDGISSLMQYSDIYESVGKDSKKAVGLFMKEMFKTNTIGADGSNPDIGGWQVAYEKQNLKLFSSVIVHDIENGGSINSFQEKDNPGLQKALAEKYAEYGLTVDDIQQIHNFSKNKMGSVLNVIQNSMIEYGKLAPEEQSKEKYVSIAEALQKKSIEDAKQKFLGKRSLTRTIKSAAQPTVTPAAKILDSGRD